MKSFEMDEDRLTVIRQREMKGTAEPECPFEACKIQTWWVERPLYFLLPYLHVKKHIRVLYFCSMVTILSVLKVADLFFRVEFLTGKHSFFNQYLVKLGWGWTLGAIGFLRACCLPLHANWKQHLWNLLIRLSILTFFFYIMCQVFFPMVEEYSGHCVRRGIVSNVSGITKKKCLRMKGHEFHAVDISGHAFLMPYCILALMEESKELIYVLCLGQFLRKSAASAAGRPDTASVTATTSSSDDEESSSSTSGNLVVTSSLSAGEVEVLQGIYWVTVPFVVCASVAAAWLSVTWDVMLVVTTLYYHAFVEKAVGALLAVALSYAQYALIFVSFDVL